MWSVYYGDESAESLKMSVDLGSAVDIDSESVSISYDIPSSYRDVFKLYDAGQ
jgi:hypothetical protein